MHIHENLHITHRSISRYINVQNTNTCIQRIQYIYTYTNVYTVYVYILTIYADSWYNRDDSLAIGVQIVFGQACNFLRTSTLCKLCVAAYTVKKIAIFWRVYI